MQVQLSPHTCVLEKLESDVCGGVFWNGGIVSDVTANVTLQLLPRSFIKNPQQQSPFFQECSCSACGQCQSVAVWQTLKTYYPKRLSWVVGTGAHLWLSAIAVDLGIWLWPLVVKRKAGGSYVSLQCGMEQV